MVDKKGELLKVGDRVTAKFFEGEIIEIDDKENTARVEIKDGIVLCYPEHLNKVV